MHGQGSVWVQFGGRCYLVAKEHCRSLSPEEETLDETPLKNQMEHINRMLAEPAGEYDDLVGQPAAAEDLEAAAARPAEGDDFDDDAADGQSEEATDVPEELRKISAGAGWHFDARRRPVLVVHDAWALRTPTPRFQADAWPFRSTWACRGGHWAQLEDHVEWRAMSQPHGLLRPPAAKLVVRFETELDEDGVDTDPRGIPVP